jgi:HK97 family phage major capsid protein
MSDTQYDIEKAVNTVRQIHEKLEKSEHLSADRIETLNKEFDAMSAKLDAQEDQNQNLVKQLAEEKEVKKELIEKFDNLEKQISRYGSGNPEYKQKSMGIKALENFLAFGEANAITKSYLRTDNNINGGFLMKPEDVDNMIIKPITETTKLRKYAKVRQVNSLKAADIVRDFLVNTFWTKEGDTRQTSNSQYGKVNIFVHSQTAEVEYTQESVLDSMFNLENEIQADVVERFAQQEGAAFR